MIKLEDAQITDVLPFFMSEEARTKALSEAVNCLIRMILKYIPKAMLMTNIDNLDEEVVDTMAVDLRTHFYDETLPLETKKELVKNSIYWHMIAGTPEAIETLADTVFGEGEVGEWFEEELDHGYFNVRTVNQIVTNNKADDFIRLLESVKRKSQHLATVQIVSDGQMDLRYSIATIEQEIDVCTVI